MRRIREKVQAAGLAALVCGLALLAGVALGAPSLNVSPQGVAATASGNTVIYPPQQLPLTFSHARHAGVACLDCHSTARTSQSVVDRMLPGEAVCARCHPIDRNQPDLVVAGAPTATCISCHPGFVVGQPVARVQIPTPNLKFSHAAHATATCETCHGDVASLERATRAQLPSMATCMTCHNDTVATSACGACHLQEIGGTIRTQFEDGKLVPSTRSLSSAVDDTHDPDFLRRHGSVSRAATATCASCHEERFCTDCHVGDGSARAFHPPGYAEAHSVEARRGTPDCTACHRTQTFCIACHERSGVGTRAASDFASGDSWRAFHPVGWASVSIAAPNLHAAEARRNLTTCTSCHREDDCLACHSAQPGLVNISPHPRGFRGSANCRAMDQKNRRTCLRCHITPDELGCDWNGLSPTP